MYWPTSLFMRSYNLPLTCKQELMHIGQPGAVLSENTLVMCHKIASQSPHNGTSLVLICSEDTPSRRAYLRHPSTEDWLALERGGFVDSQQGFGFTMDALH